MRVVLQQNLEPDAGLVNGTQGTVIGFEPYNENKMPRPLNDKNDPGPAGAPTLGGDHALFRAEQIREYAKTNGERPWPVVLFDHGSTRTVYADCTLNEYGTEEPHSLLSRTQIPLMAGYAITVHKCQVCRLVAIELLISNVAKGMTLERVIVDLKRAFEPSQIYVARKFGQL
jgi:ATP-dependent DNA helicase PIF1